LLGGHIGEIIVDLRVIDIDVITCETEAKGHNCETRGFVCSPRHLVPCRWAV
jgi:hypothetical protein